MTFLERYQNGETTEVYKDIDNLGPLAFSENHFVDVEAVVTETMKRVSHNLAAIYDELEKINYNFNRNIQHSFQAPLNKPNANVDKLLTQLEKIVSPFGYIPLSLKSFYQIVGSCNFAWNYETNKIIPWRCSDPIQIVPLEELMKELSTDWWAEEMAEQQDDLGAAYLELSADYLHKDNISGGPAYAAEITRTPSIDSKFLNEEHQTTFINYLRIVFDNCGFGRIDDLESTDTFISFRNKVRPRLKRI